MLYPSNESQIPINFCMLERQDIFMLHQFVKKTDKTPPKDLACARKRMKEWKDADA